MTQYTIATWAGAATTLTQDSVEAFRQRLRGPLLSPLDAGFADATLLWNGMISKTPALVVQPTGTGDIVAAVDFAREHGLALSVRGGGHNIAGTALADGGLTIDMSRLRGILVDPRARTATVQAECLLGDVDRETQRHGLATPLGFVSEVGVAGLTLGGGLGYLTRRFGWTVDNLLEVEIVTADGRVRRASRDENADLFWAIRGAGANLVVVTSFTFWLHEVGPTVYGGLIAWPFERAEEILQAYRAITTEAPRELAVWLNLIHAPPDPPSPGRAGMKVDARRSPVVSRKGHCHGCNDGTRIGQRRRAGVRLRRLGCGGGIHPRRRCRGLLPALGGRAGPAGPLPGDPISTAGIRREHPDPWPSLDRGTRA